MRRLGFFALALLLATPLAARADAPINQPDLISFGLGFYDFDKTEPMKQATDYRLEYRWGVSLLPLVIPSLRSWDSDVQFHPFLATETNDYGALYGLGGYDMDWYISKHFIFTWSEGVGFFDRGSGARMGSFLQFRSEAEFGYRFDNDMRLTPEFSHISDAKITHLNPGAEIVGVYLHVPTNLIFGK